ncbi:MAG: hypothetical protein O9972_22835 [Burkholderiales bacterium]|nr:hypothetical protein [Burkholderiales bacterium]
MKNLVLGGLLAALAGCSTLDRTEISDLKAENDGSYTFRAGADAVYPHDDPAAEAIRMEWLAKWMKDNGFCPNGYNVSNRNTILVRQSALAEIRNVYYRVTCK